MSNMQGFSAKLQLNYEPNEPPPHVDAAKSRTHGPELGHDFVFRFHTHVKMGLQCACIPAALCGAGNVIEENCISCRHSEIITKFTACFLAGVHGWKLHHADGTFRCSNNPTIVSLRQATPTSERRLGMWSRRKRHDRPTIRLQLVSAQASRCPDHFKTIIATRGWSESMKRAWM